MTLLALQLASIIEAQPTTPKTMHTTNQPIPKILTDHDTWDLMVRDVDILANAPDNNRAKRHVNAYLMARDIYHHVRDTEAPIDLIHFAEQICAHHLDQLQNLTK